MKRIMVATHGYLANGIKSTIDLLVGDACLIEVINAYVDDSDYTPVLEKFLKDSQAEEAYVFTDLYVGSVNQKAVILKERYDFTLITGFNLAVLIGVVLGGDNLSKHQLEEIIHTSRDELKLVELETSDGKEEEFF